MDNIAERAVRAIASGLIAGIVTALLLFVVSALVPGLVISASFWGMIVGILVALYTFFVGRSNLL